jgi:hypothetical protein
VLFSILPSSRSFSSSVARCTCSLYSAGVHFLRNRKRPFGDFPSAVRIAETFDFFFSGLAGGVDVFLSPKDLFFEDEASAKRELCLDDVLDM